MPRLGVDLFSLCVIGTAFILSQIRQIPARLRFVIMAAACGVVAVYQFRKGAEGFNLAVCAVAAAFCLANLIRAMQYRPPPVS